MNSFLSVQYALWICFGRHGVHRVLGLACLADGSEAALCAYDALAVRCFASLPDSRSAAPGANGAVYPGLLNRYNFAHVKRGFFHQNNGKPPFTSCTVQVYNVRIPVTSGERPQQPPSARAAIACHTAPRRMDSLPPHVSLRNRVPGV